MSTQRMELEEPLHSASEGAPAPFSFSVLGQKLGDIEDDAINYQGRREAHFSARKACAMLRVTSAIVNAVVVHPGGDCDEQQLAETTRELMRRATHLTDAATELLDVAPGHPGFAGYRNLLRQQAAEVVATQWRMANSAGGTELSVEQISAMFKIVLNSGEIEKDGELPSYPSDMDATTARRLSILGVIPEIYGAVNSFDYFTPNPETLVEKGVREVSKSAEEGVRRMASPKAGSDAVTMLTQSLIGKAGALYAANYRALARRDVLALQQMDSMERKRHIYIHRESGMSTAHVDESFNKLMGRMVEMVCEAVPELGQVPTASPVLTSQESHPNKPKARQHELKPD